MPTYSTFHQVGPVKSTTQEKLSPFTCEFVGTFVLVFVVSCCSNGSTPGLTATAVAFTLIALIYSVGHVSGGHLNPCVSFTLWLARKINFLTMVLYIILQILGGVLAGLLGALTFNKSPTVASVAPFTIFEAVFVEGVYTMFFCFVVLNVAASTKKNPQDDPNQFFAVAIGFVFLAGSYAVGNVSGGYFNPALAFGLDLAGFIDTLTLGESPLYLLGQGIGALGAAFLYHVFRHHEAAEGEYPDYVHPTTLTMRLGAEFFGTFMIVLTYGLATVLGGALVGFATAAAYVSMMYAIGDISGGHYNPAITFAVALSGRGKLPKTDALMYVVAQLFAGLMASLFIAHFHSLGPKPHASFALDPKEGYSWLTAGIAEFTFTALLCFVFVAIATARLPLSLSTNQNFYYALAIGMTLAIGGFAAGPISGGCLNPAATLSLAVEGSSGATTAEVFSYYEYLKKYFGLQDGITSSTTTPPNETKETVKTALFYVLFELLGGLVATILFHLSHASEFIPVVGAKPFGREAYAHYA